MKSKSHQEQAQRVKKGKKYDTVEKMFTGVSFQIIRKARSVGFFSVNLSDNMIIMHIYGFYNTEEEITSTY